MRTCPRCQDRYDDEARFCARDGEPLFAATVGDEQRIGQVLMGQFELREIIGRGAMGSVFKAWQRGIDREVAVKLLRADLVRDPSIVKRFMREAQSVARLSHPNIVTVFMVGQTDDQLPYLVMEYVHGLPLSVPVASGQRLPTERVLRVVRQIASALGEAHASGVIHRDLKPANILLTERRRTPDFVKVVDFGIAKLIDSEGGPAPGQSALTRTGTMFGTPHYVAPEQAQGLPVDGRADLYSLGVIMFVLATGRVPFDGTGMAVVVQHVNKAPPRPRAIAPEVPPAFEQLILELLEKDRARRPQSAEIVIDRIDALWRELGLHGELVPRSQTEPPMAPPTRDPGAMTMRADARSLPMPAVVPPPAAPMATGFAPTVGQGASGAHAQPPRAGSLPPPALSLPSPASVIAAPVAAARLAPPVLDAAETAPPLTPAHGVAGASAAASYGSDEWRAPSRSRGWVIGGLVVLLLGGAAAGGVYLWQQQRGAAPPATTAAAPDAAAPALVEPKPEPAPPPSPPGTKVVTLGEDGWAVRVQVPLVALASTPIALELTVWDPKGELSRSRKLRVLVTDPAGAQHEFAALPTEEVGHFSLTAPLVAGSHEVRIFPEGTSKGTVAVWFTLEVAGDGAAPARTTEPVKAPPPPATPTPATKPPPRKPSVVTAEPKPVPSSPGGTSLGDAMRALEGTPPAAKVEPSPKSPPPAPQDPAVFSPPPAPVLPPPPPAPVPGPQPPPSSSPTLE